MVRRISPNSGGCENTKGGYWHKPGMASPIITLVNLWKSTINHRLTPLIVALTSHIRQGLRKKNYATENVEQPAVSSPAKEAASITDILKEMSDRQSFLTEELRKKRIRSNLFHNIQDELLKEWKTPPVSPGLQSPEEEIINLTLDTTRKLGLYNNAFEEKDLQFMLKIGWKLAQYNLGLPRKLEADDQYPARKAELVKRAASISNEEMGDALTAYLSFSFGLNSGYLFYSLLANSRMKMPLRNKLSPSKIKYTRDTSLQSLLSYIQRLADNASQGAAPN